MGTDVRLDSRTSEVSYRLAQNGIVPMLLVGLAALALGQALQNGNGFLTLPGLGWLTFALTFAVLSIASQRRPLPPLSSRVFWAILVGGLIWQLFQLLTSPPGQSTGSAYIPQLWQFRSFVGVAGICAVLSLAPRPWFLARIRMGLYAAAFLGVLSAGVWIIHAAPKPFIDVYLFQQTSSRALLQGKNPYELTPPNIYGDLRFYGPELVKNGKMTIGNPYPPLSIYLSFIGYVLARDIRYTCLAAILLTGLLIALQRPGPEALLAAYVFLFTPRIYYVLEQSWTEPLVLFLAVAVVWCAIHRPRWKFIALGLLVASKQYVILLLPMAALLIPIKSLRRNWAASLGWTTGVAAAVTAPLALRDLPAFMWNVGLAQFYQPFRPDALSYAALYARVTEQIPTPLFPFIALGASISFVWSYCKRSAAGFAAAFALSSALFFAFNKQAFCNYYFLVIGMLCCALAAMPGSHNLLTTTPEQD